MSFVKSKQLLFVGAVRNYFIHINQETLFFHLKKSENIF